MEYSGVRNHLLHNLELVDIVHPFLLLLVKSALKMLTSRHINGYQFISNSFEELTSILVFLFAFYSVLMQLIPIPLDNWVQITSLAGSVETPTLGGFGNQVWESIALPLQAFALVCNAAICERNKNVSYNSYTCNCFF